MCAHMLACVLVHIACMWDQRVFSFIMYALGIELGS